MPFSSLNWTKQFIHIAVPTYHARYDATGTQFVMSLIAHIRHFHDLDCLGHVLQTPDLGCTRDLFHLFLIASTWHGLPPVRAGDNVYLV